MYIKHALLILNMDHNNIFIPIRRKGKKKTNEKNKIYVINNMMIYY